MDIEAVGESLIRPGQLLTDRGALSVVARWTQAVAEADGVCVIHLKPGTDPCEITMELREQGFRASPNHVLAGQPLFWGGPASRPFPAQPVPYKRGRERSPVTVGLLDTGIARHPWWSGASWYDEQSRDDDDAPDGERAGHGTFLAGLLVRRAPGVGLRSRRVLDARGTGDEAAVVRALNRLRERPPHVLNLSFGCHTFDGRPPPMLSDALGGLPDTVTVACAGNTASDRPFWPAALPGVVAVGALDATEQHRAPFSAYGPWVDACARGEWLTSSFLVRDDFTGYATWSGTSFATALVAGAIADAARHRPVNEAAALVLDPGSSRQFPDLGVLVPSSL
jgi:subtilisin family serine protease